MVSIMGGSTSSLAGRATGGDLRPGGKQLNLCLFNRGALKHRLQ